MKDGEEGDVGGGDHGTGKGFSFAVPALPKIGPPTQTHIRQQDCESSVPEEPRAPGTGDATTTDTFLDLGHDHDGSRSQLTLTSTSDDWIQRRVNDSTTSVRLVTPDTQLDRGDADMPITLMSYDDLDGDTPVPSPRTREPTDRGAQITRSQSRGRDGDGHKDGNGGRRWDY